MWFEERSEKSRNTKDVKFSICCQKGTVQLPLLEKPPYLLSSLMSGGDNRSNHFKENIRAYNSMFSFTSIGGKVESSINNGSGPPQFILSGQNYHRIGSLLPNEGSAPKFAQLYIYDTQNELQNRTGHFWYVSSPIILVLELEYYSIVSMYIFTLKHNIFIYLQVRQADPMLSEIIGSRSNNHD